MRPRLTLILALLVLTSAALPPDARAQLAGFTVLHQFGTNPDGFYPSGPLIQGANGNFYGATSRGGANATGTIFSVTPAGLFSTVYTFSARDPNNLNADGASPNALVQESDGNFYGTTLAGGSSGLGTLFRLTPSGVLTVLYTFGISGLQAPENLLASADGVLYGTTTAVGKMGGSIYAIVPGGTPKILYSFAENSFASALVQGRDGNLYGAAVSGNGDSTFFTITAAGTYSPLQTLPSAVAGLIQGADGNFYVTANKSDYEEDSVESYLYSITSAGTVTTIYKTSFFSDTGSFGSLMQGSDGNFYVNIAGDAEVEQLTPAGVRTTFYGFPFSSSEISFVQGLDGNFYGTTQQGGANNVGLLFSLSPAGAETTLHDFAASDGSGPQPLVEGTDGNLYGTTGGPGGGNDGVAYRLTPDGVFTILQIFGPAGGSAVYGTFPGPLVAGLDGNIYGTTGQGGAYGRGTFFRFTTAGVFTKLHDFSTSEISTSGGLSSLIQGSDGDFYGTSFGGGSAAQGYGSIFSLSPAGVLTVLYNFAGKVDGSNPVSLIEKSPGLFYGLTYVNTFFSFQSTGVLTTLYTFASYKEPTSGVTLGNDGNFYGCSFGSQSPYDATFSPTLFRLTPAGVLTNLNYFGDLGIPGPLTLGADGNFYGAVNASGDGGTPKDGSVIQVTSAGNISLLQPLTASEGNFSSLLQGSDGNLYGATAGFNAAGQTPASTYGTIFKFPLASVAAVPRITSAENVTTAFGEPFNYQITANLPALSYTATGLFRGFRLHPRSGQITATPPEVVSPFLIQLQVQTAAGIARGVLALSVVPVATLATTTPHVRVGSGEVGTFTVRLSAHPNVALAQVQFTVGGTAINGTDYVHIGDFKQFSANNEKKTSKMVTITPKGDLNGASSKVVELKLQPSPDYVLGKDTMAKIRLLPAKQ